MSKAQLQRGDCVAVTRYPEMVGTVTRVASDGSWVDVRWPQWSKRQPKPSILQLIDRPTARVTEDPL